MTLYLDTSVFGGCFDKEFELWSRALVNKILAGKYSALISELTLDEISHAPLYVRELANEVVSMNSEIILVDKQSRELAGRYLHERILTQKSDTDSLHIALATIHHADILLSWNFKHIVNLNRIRLYNSVNLAAGYAMLEIRSPREIVQL